MTLAAQQYSQVSEFSPAWNSFVFHESARTAEELGYGRHPLAFLNDVLYPGA